MVEESCLCRKVLAEEHPSRLMSQQVLAGTYQSDGQVQKAVALLEYVVAVEARFLRDDHPSWLVSLNALTYLRAELRGSLEEYLYSIISSE
jgi:hypothetical protein